MMSDTGYMAKTKTAPGLLAQLCARLMNGRSFACFAFVLFALLGSKPLLAQKVYPIEANLQLTPPYSLYLGDYTTGEERLKVNLFLKDLTKTNYPVRLKLKIEGFGITIVSKNNFYTPPIYLNAGQLHVLSGTDLQDYFNPQNLVFQGIDLKEFNRNGAKLPEGVYRISIEVEDYTRRQVVSNAGTAVLSAFLSYPPVINQPMANAKVTALFPQNLVFQWMPRHTASFNAAFNIVYRVRLVEVNPSGRDPNDAMRSSRPLFETITNLTQYVYGPSEPQLVPGNTYALQVQALDADGKDAFVNQGYSEVVRFVYGEKCAVPINVLAQLQDKNSLQLSWVQLPMQQRYTVRYREANNSKAIWFEQEVYTTQFSARGLRPATTYEYQVKAACDYGYGDYSVPQQFTMPNEEVTTGDIVCGEPSQIKAPANKKLLPILQPGMIFMAGSFPVRVTEVQGAGESFTGKGTIGVPYLNKLSFAVEFKDIQINTDLKLLSGKVSIARQSLEQSQEAVKQAITVTPDENGVVEAIASNGLPTIIDVAIAVPATLPAYNAKDKTVTFAGITNNGTSKEITIKLKDGQPPLIFQDKNGETYEVDANGKVTHKGKVSTAEMLAGGDLTNKLLSTDKATVAFIKLPDQKYGLDLFQQSLAANSRYKEDYQQVPTSQGSAYVSWKSVEAGASDVVVAEITNVSVDLDKIEFRTGKGDKLTRKKDGKRFTISLIGAPEGNDREIYAFYPTDKDGKEGLNLGKLNIASFKKLTKKVIVVPVNSAGLHLSADDIRTYLNGVYKQAVVDWTVEMKGNFVVDIDKWDANRNGLEAGNSSLLSAYTPEQKKLVDLYKDKYRLEDNTYYLFLVNKFSDPSQKGYMVRGGQVGFVAVPDSYAETDKSVLHTMAHELGHGAFNLQHTWDVYGAETQGKTDNLMDYGSGLGLTYAQWKYMRNSDIIFRPFEGDDEGALFVSAAMLTFEDEATKVETNFHKYLTPSGKVIALPKPSTSQSVLLGFADEKNIEAGVPEGTLLSFTIGQKQFKATIISGEFKGYFASSDNEPYKSIVEIPSGLQIEVRVGKYTSACFASGYYITYSNPVVTSLKGTGAGTLSEVKSFLPKERSEDFRLSCPSGSFEVAMGELVTDPRKYLIAGFKDEKAKKEFEGRIEVIAKKIKGLDKWYVNSGTVTINHLGTKEWLENYERDLDTLTAQVAKIKGLIASPTLTIATVASILKMLEGEDKKNRQFQSLTATERLNLLAVLASHTLTDYNGRELQTLKIITATPSEQYEEMLEGLSKRKDKEQKHATLLVGLAKCIDGDNFISYVEHLNKWIKTRYSYNEVELLANQKYLKFKPGFWTGDDLSKSFTSTGTINFTTLPNYKKLERAEVAGIQNTSYQALRDISPYEFIIVQFENDFKGYSKGDKVVLPALYVYYLFNEENNIRLLKGSKLAVDVALIAIGVGEVRAAIALGQGAYRSYLILKAGADLGVGTMDLVIQEGYAEEWSKTEEGQKRLERWNNLNLMFAAATLSASAVDGVISRLGKRTIQTEKEWVQAIEELEGVGNWITYIGKSVDKQIDAPVGYFFYNYNGRKFLRRINASDVNTPRLTVKDGKIIKYDGQTVSTLSTTQVNDLAISSTIIPSSPKGVMLGKYNPDLSKISYNRVAKDNGYIYFEMENWDEVFKLVNESYDEMWKINEQVIIKQFNLNRPFYFSHNPNDISIVGTGSFYEQEIELLKKLVQQKYGKTAKFSLSNQYWKLEW